MSISSIKPTFSIVVPTFNCLEKLKQTLNSLINQSYDKNLYEIIIVDDGSTDGTKEFLRSLRIIVPEIIVHEFPENKGKIAARNKGMELASGEWICWCDTEDVYIPTYLSAIAEAIKEHPEAEVFNFGALVFEGAPPVRSSVRDTFLPGLRADGRGHDSFKSGRISSGQFVFKKALLSEPDIGYLPESRIAYGSDDSFAALCSKRYAGINELYGQNEQGEWIPFGNPFGDDYAMFFVLTRNHISVPIMAHLYIQYLRP